MATVQAIRCVCDAVARVIRSAPAPTGLSGAVAVEIFGHSNFENPQFTLGISVFVARARVDGTHRNPTRVPTPGVSRSLPSLPVSISLLVTAWASQASSQQVLLAWAMRAIADQPLLTAATLNEGTPGVFAADETVELVLDDVPPEEMFQLWERLKANTLQLSTIVTARGIQIDSMRVRADGKPVTTREWEIMQAGANG